MIPYGRQTISEEDIAAVLEVLTSDHLTQGPAVGAFEAALAAACGAREAVAVANGTAALHLACTALGLGPGDRLWTSPITYVASANCALYCGADVDFVDVDPRTQNLDPAALERKLKAAAREGRLPAVVVPVHFSGRPCDMEAIGALAREYGFHVVEDATHALGARAGDRPVGACEHSRLAAFSFHPVKIVTSGEGGALTTNDPRLAERLRRLRSHGVVRDVEGLDGPWAYALEELGFNYRLTDLQAALGASQLRRLEAIVRRRGELADRYRRLLGGLPVELPPPVARGRSAWHLFVIRLPEEGPPRGEVFAYMRGQGIGVHVHYIPVHTQPLYRRRGFAPGDYPVAESYYRRALTLPLYPDLTHAEQDRVVESLRQALAGAAARSVGGSDGV